MSDQEMGVEHDAPSEAATQETEHSQQAAPKESDADRNWRQMREQLEELKRYNQRLESEVLQSRERQQPKAEEEEFNYSEEDLPTVGVTKKLIQREASKIAKEMLREKEMTDAEKWARLKFSDYDAVVNKSNLEQLAQTDPELAKMIMANPDPVGVYKLLKRTGVDSNEMQQLKDNQNKPRSSQSVGQASALSQANAFAKGLTPELRSQLWKEMQEAVKAH